MAKKKKCPDCPSVAKWMTTFSDMSTLLLTFFVLLLSMSSIDKVKLDQAFGLLSGGKGLFEGSSDDSKYQPILITQTTAGKAAESSVESLKSYIEAQNLQNMISVAKTQTGFSVTILDSVFFSSGSTVLLAQALPVLDKIAGVAVDSPFYINIEGHTDDTPTRAGGLSNWDISTLRALSVLKYFQQREVAPQKLSATGFGEYHPVLPNITEENRAKNRRVEINFVSPEFASSNKNLFE